MPSVSSPSIDVFKQRIQGSPNICNNCYRRWWTEYEKNFYVDTYDGDVWVRPIRRSIRGIVDPYRESEEVEFGHDDIMTHGQTSYCECGVSHWTMMNDRPVEKSVALEMVERVGYRFEEIGYCVDIDAAIQLARDKLSEPDNQGKQDITIAKCVIRHTVPRIGSSPMRGD